MERYFITAEPKECFDFKGKSLGFTNKRIVCKGKGYKRYRQDEDNIGKGLKPVSYKSEKMAQALADHTNELFGDNFVVEKREVGYEKEKA